VSFRDSATQGYQNCPARKIFPLLRLDFPLGAALVAPPYLRKGEFSHSLDPEPPPSTHHTRTTRDPSATDARNPPMRSSITRVDALQRGGIRISRVLAVPPDPPPENAGFRGSASNDKRVDAWPRDSGLGEKLFEQTRIHELGGSKSVGGIDESRRVPG